MWTKFYIVIGFVFIFILSLAFLGQGLAAVTMVAGIFIGFAFTKAYQALEQAEKIKLLEEWDERNASREGEE